MILYNLFNSPDSKTGKLSLSYGRTYITITYKHLSLSSHELINNADVNLRWITSYFVILDQTCAVCLSDCMLTLSSSLFSFIDHT